MKIVFLKVSRRHSWTRRSRAQSGSTKVSMASQGDNLPHRFVLTNTVHFKLQPSSLLIFNRNSWARSAKYQVTV